MTQELQNHLSEKQLARRWNLSPRTLQRRRAAGLAPAWMEIGHRIVYPFPEILRVEQALLQGGQRGQ